MKSGRFTITWLTASSLVWLAGLGVFNIVVCAQGGLDYLTEREIEVVRQAQQINWRVKVFMKIAERRLMLAEDPQATQADRDKRNWGPLPSGSRAEMLKQYQQAIEETIINFEDTYDRNPKDKNLPKALTIFRQHTENHLPRLQALRSRITDQATGQVLEQTLEELSLAAEDARQSQQELRSDQERPKTPKKKKGSRSLDFGRG